jgi:uncharacterized protein YhbP (UPF0306 family)
MHNEKTAIRVAAFLDAHHVMSLATTGPEGPHAANVLYARDGFALLWLSDPTSQHSVELAAGGRVAATVAPDYFDFNDIRGVQIVGRAHLIVTTTENAKARVLLEARYPALRQLAHAPPALREGYARATCYRLEPIQITLIDNSCGFGHKETIELTSANPGTPAHNGRTLM